MNTIARLAQLGSDPRKLEYHLKGLQIENPEGFTAVETFLEDCVSAGAQDLEKTASHLCDYPHGELTFLLSEKNMRAANDYIVSRGFDRDPYSVEEEVDIGM